MLRPVSAENFAQESFFNVAEIVCWCNKEQGLRAMTSLWSAPAGSFVGGAVAK
jgi:hypothetical protein